MEKSYCTFALVKCNLRLRPKWDSYVYMGGTTLLLGGRTAMSKKAPVIPDVLSCLLTQDGETKFWIGHCLNFDLVTSGKDPDSAWENLRAVIKTHIEHCFTHHWDGLKSEAPRADWLLFDALKNKQPLMRTEKITLRLIAPQTEQVPPFWIQGVESDFLGEGREQAAGTAIPAVH